MSQKILVTGTNSGFGRLITLTLARKGHSVFATMRDVAGRNRAAAEEYKAIASREGLKIEVLELDLTKDESVESTIGAVLKKAEYLDVVVNNAGYAVLGHEEGVTSAQLTEQLDVNVVGPQRVMRAVLPTLRTRGKGLVINVSSGLGRLVLPFMGAYGASKAALEYLTDAYRYELKPLGVDVVLIQPGGFPTDFGSRLSIAKDATRAPGYGPLANGVQMMNHAFEQMFAGPNPPNPQVVADAVLKVIDSPAGSRPDRVVVDPQGGQGVEAMNRVHNEVQKATLSAMGMGQLV